MKSGFFRSWYSELRRFDFRCKSSVLPHLSLRAGYVTLFLTSFLASRLSNDLAIIIHYGPHAYFHHGLRVYSKYGILSDGSYFPFVGSLAQFPVTLVFWVALMLTADFCAMLIHYIVDKYGHWAKTGLCFFCGVALLVFAGVFYDSYTLGLAPLYALIGGTVLTLESFSLLFRRPAKSEAQPR